MPPVGFEPTILASERPLTYALDRAATGTGYLISYFKQYNSYKTNYCSCCVIKTKFFEKRLEIIAVR